MKRLFGVFAVLIILFSVMACAGKQPTTARQVYNEVNLINKDLPQRIGNNTILESVTFDEIHSVLVCHFTVDTWDRPNVVAEKQSKHQKSLLIKLLNNNNLTLGYLHRFSLAYKASSNNVSTHTNYLIELLKSISGIQEMSGACWLKSLVLNTIKQIKSLVVPLSA